MKKICLKVNSIKRGSKDYLGDYLKTLGIKDEDICSFTLVPRATDADEPENLSNLKPAVEKAYEMLSRGANVYVQPDPDTDGFTSASVLISYLKHRFPNINISWKLHEGKDHGIVPEYIDDNVNLVFIPDAGSNDYDKQKELIGKGKTVIILDHHEVENFQNTGAYLINNQASVNFSNKNMSGVGIVYMFIKEMDRLYFVSNPIADNYLDLVAVGIIADAMSMKSLGNNYIVYYGLQNIRNKFLKQIIDKQKRGIKNPNWVSKIEVAFYIAPVINGVIRSGSTEDKNAVFTAMSTDESDEVFTSEWRGVTRNENLWERAARLAVNAKSRQDAAKKKGFEWLCGLIEENGWDKHNLIIATLNEEQSKKLNPNFTGLIAMELVKKYNKPCLVLRASDYEGVKVFGGSGRNGNFYGLPSLLDFLLESGLTKYCAGHANAFGTYIVPENIAMLREYSDKHLKSEVFTDDRVDVDYWFNDESIDKDMLMAFAEADKLYGNSIPQPKFAFTFYNYNESNYKVMGKDLASLKMSFDGVDFVVFKNAAVVHSVGQHRGGCVTIIGRPQINEWNGRKTIQIMVDEIEATDEKKTEPAVVEINWEDLI